MANVLWLKRDHRQRYISYKSGKRDTFLSMGRENYCETAIWIP